MGFKTRFKTRRRSGGTRFLYPGQWLGKRRTQRRPLSPGPLPKAKKSPPGRGYIILALALLLVGLFVHSYYRFDRRILPLVLEAAELRLQAEINNVINYTVQEIITSRNLQAEEFLIKGGTPASPVLSVNTVLVNDICNAAAQAISHRLNNLEPEIVEVPMGMAFGLDTLAQSGPRFRFYLAPIGNALVHYQSSFTAVGINQTHFAVWLNVESVVRIINPVHSTEITVERTISLVDTVISGIVPETYLNMDGGIGFGIAP